MPFIEPKALRELLKSALAGPLPGRAAQERMLSEARRGRASAAPLRPSAVLVAIISGERPSILLIERARGGPHGGQIAFPGGREEASDSGPIDTALREAREEVGLDPACVETLGFLTPLEVAVSSSLIRPVVGLVAARPALALNPAEAVRTLELPLELLFDPAAKARREVLPVDGPLLAPCYLVEGAVVWGATAMILSELEEALARARK
jgi:8-oxo-dGTP pyrophosphatase MutT (NUDIX family)